MFRYQERPLCGFSDRRDKMNDNELRDKTATATPWHTGIPAEKGWYVLHYPKSKEQPYELAEYDGEYFVTVTHLHAIVVRTEPDTVPGWQKIGP